jgi:ATP-dependent Lhr-like helicase
VGDDNVTAHHGSLAREIRLSAEQRLKSGELSALVATASLELGIDIGAVDLVIQIGSTRAISTLLAAHWPFKSHVEWLSERTHHPAVA